MVHDVSIKVLGTTERRFKNYAEMQLNEVCITPYGRNKDFDPIFILTADDDLASRMAANSIDLFFDDDIEGITITMIDKDCKGLQFEI